MYMHCYVLLYLFENNREIFQDIKYTVIIHDILTLFVSFEAKKVGRFQEYVYLFPWLVQVAMLKLSSQKRGELRELFTGQSKLEKSSKVCGGKQPMRNDVKKIRILWKTFILKKLFSILFMIMGMMFYASSGAGGKFWLEHMTEWKWSSSFLCKKISSFKSRKKLFFTLVSRKLALLPLPPAISEVQEYLQGEEGVHLLASHQGSCRVTSGGKRQLNSRKLLSLLQQIVPRDTCAVKVTKHASFVCQDLQCDDQWMANWKVCRW